MYINFLVRASAAHVLADEWEDGWSRPNILTLWTHTEQLCKVWVLTYRIYHALISQLSFLSCLSCRGHRAVFEAWFLLVRCGHWIDVAAKLLVSVESEHSEPLLFLLTFYHHPTKRGHQSIQHNVRHPVKQE